MKERFGIDLTHALREWLLCRAGFTLSKAQKVAEEFSADNMDVDWITLTDEDGKYKTFFAKGSC